MEEPTNPKPNILEVVHGHTFSADGTAKLDAALCKAKEEMVSKVAVDTDNPFFKNKYASLAALLEATTKPLAKHGIVIKQHYTNGFLHTRMSHTSGESETSIYQLPAYKNDSQGLGSAISYARRYAYMAILGLVADKDDDGNDSMPMPEKLAPKAKPKPPFLPNK